MGGDGRFHTTRWTMILSARGTDSEDASAALAELCRTYWYPAYYFVRRRGNGPDEAMDLTQSYFLRMLEKDYLEDVRPEDGKFRSFLLASLKHFLANQHRDATTIKRGGEVEWVALDSADAEGRYRQEPPDHRTPEQAYERRWALAVLGRTKNRLRAEFDDAKKLRQFQLLEPHLSADVTARSYKEIAVDLDTTESAIKMAVSRLRRAFGRLLREEIGRTVEDEHVDDEVRHLLSVIREA
ncbi:MAG: sigma-70 family RNA polymerase sigma factor [Acidobacteriota bacterium]|nr:sigma-70 family RNA polymerase sigma factor [Acidobacteriota bacterium]MDH3784991.1 sigma-70 family RNA polymerase sigma factor [Acidobacteriota bacterium]